MIVYGQTDIGLVRKENQDAFRLGQLPQEACYAIVCDGMGGAAGGSTASTMAADLIEERILSGMRENMPGDSVLHVLESAIAAANAVVHEEAMANPDLRGMGTTVVVAVVLRNNLYIAHVGDSRIYLVGDSLLQLTRDHSVVQEMVEKGQITSEEARVHPHKNLITRAIGVDVRVAFDWDQLELDPRAGLLLCSDGLTNMVEPEEIFRLIQETEPDALPGALIEAAKRAGGTDNITAVWMSS